MADFQVGDIIIIVGHGPNPFNDGDMGTLVEYVDRGWVWRINFDGFKRNHAQGIHFANPRRLRLATNQEIQERYLG